MWITTSRNREYKMVSFMFYQACENYYYTIRLSFILRNNKQHNLSKLLGLHETLLEDLKIVFPEDTQ